MKIIKVVSASKIQKRNFVLILTISCLFCFNRHGSAEKIWPKEPLRGINTCLVANKKGNSQNPGGFISDKTFKKFSEWNINLIRVFFDIDQGSKWDIKKGEMMPPMPKNEPLAPYRKQLKGLKVALELAEKYQIYVIPVAGVHRRNDILYSENDDSCFQNTLIELWKYIAKEFGKHPWLLGYDLLNEPHSANEIKYWRKITLPTLTKEIREIDKDTYFIVEPDPWGNPEGFRKLTPIEDKKVVYSFHFYLPHLYTHQGVKEYEQFYGMLAYPGELKSFPHSIAAKYWDRKQILNSVYDVRRFQKEYNVRIWVGEFSSIRWAPGAAQWLADTISVFEEYGWDWCYHSYGEWNGWNPTFSAGDPVNSENNNTPDGGKMTDRLLVLLKAWGKNSKY